MGLHMWMAMNIGTGASQAKEDTKEGVGDILANYCYDVQLGRDLLAIKDAMMAYWSGNNPGNNMGNAGRNRANMHVWEYRQELIR